MQTEDLQPAEAQLSARQSRRHRRAEAVRKRALSPFRILMMVLLLPVTTCMIAVGVYMRTTDYNRHEAVVHLVALAGCDAARAIGLGPFRKGYAGYHTRNDPDGDGVACGTFVQRGASAAPARPAQAPKNRSVGGAKFVRP